jgi:hypothetical protein
MIGGRDLPGEASHQQFRTTVHTHGAVEYRGVGVNGVNAEAQLPGRLLFRRARQKNVHHPSYPRWKGNWIRTKSLNIPPMIGVNP